MRTRRDAAVAVEAISRRGLFARLWGGAAVGLLAIRPPARAGIPIPATEITQLLNHLELILQYIRQASQLVSLVNQEKMMVTNLVHNGFHGLSSIAGFLGTAAGIAQGGLAIAYSTANMDAMFQKTFPGYATFDSSHPWAQSYLNWANTNRATIAGTMRVLNLSANDLASSQAMAAVVRSHASGAQGTQQMLETLGEFGSAQVNELQGLRELMLADQQSKLGFMAHQQQQMDTAAAAQAKFFTLGAPPPVDARVYDPTKGVY